MNTKQTYFPRTTRQQRRLLFEIWETTESVKEACEKARVSKRTFYNWKPRFEAEGYAGLEKARSHAPKNPRRTSEEVTQQVVKMKVENPEWGKRRIADELAKANSWVPVVSPNTVKRILRDGGIWTKTTPPAKKGGYQVVPARQRPLGKP